MGEKKYFIVLPGCHVLPQKMLPLILTHNKIMNKARDDINYFNFNVKMHKKKP
jgi:hypothetical protein